MPDSAWEAVLAYHERSKHRLQRYAPGPGRLDWANQPDPFREFEGAARVELALGADALATRYDDVRSWQGDGAGHSPAKSDIAVLLELSLALSAWKSYAGTRWALRCNPSSGNLHPTEGYVVTPAVAGLDAGVYHYVSRDHALERRAAIGDARWNGEFAGAGFIVGLASIYWREAWKYGMRGWRYCQHDCGHAIAAVSYAAAALGWPTRLMEGASDADIAGLLGLGRDEDFADAEREAPDALLWIGDPDRMPDLSRLVSLARTAPWSGRANRLSDQHVEWSDIDAVHRATEIQDQGVRSPGRRRDSTQVTIQVTGLPSNLPPCSFARIARQRRSAVDFDGVTRIGEGAFFAMLECLLARGEAPPWNVLATAPLVHPALLVHRVDGLDPGLYVLMRDPSALDEMKSAMRPDWLWRKVGPGHLPLYLLLAHDLRAPARTISCHQDIAADSCFALGMLARLAVVKEAPWRYRHLFWECGMLGHVLYLEAEASDIRATGIGCFFDDEMHALLGLADSTWQSLYHFTAGGPVEDRRLSTLPPYGSPV